MEITIEAHGIAEAAKAANGMEDEVLQAADQGVRLCLQRHFMARQTEPRQDGFPQQGFWIGNKGFSVWERVRPTEFGANCATIRIASAALAHKVAANPPPIVPKRGKWLTIPAVAEAVGISARDHADLHFGYVQTRNGNAAVKSQGGRIGGKSQGGKVDKRPALLDSAGRAIYWLARRVQTRHDPRALPTHDALSKAVADAIKTYLSNAVFS